MHADYLRFRSSPPADLGATFDSLVEAYDHCGLPWERTLTRLSQGRWLMATGHRERAVAIASEALDLGRRYRMTILAADAQGLLSELAEKQDRTAISRSEKLPRRP
jgi:hypothetical protein